MIPTIIILALLAACVTAFGCCRWLAAWRRETRSDCAMLRAGMDRVGRAIDRMEGRQAK